MTLSHRGLCLTVCLLLASATGCAALRMPNKLVKNDVSQQRETRSQDAIRQFEQQRDAAEFEAARARWEQQRDPKGCREELEKLLARNPRHRDALLLLAELHLSEDNTPEAHKQAKAALDFYPNDPHVQYTMAMAMDAMGQSSDALGYYERATKMAPDSELYAEGYRTARQAVRETIHRSKATVLEVAGPTSDSPNGLTATAYTQAPTPASRAADSDSAQGAAPADSAGNAESDPAKELVRKGQTALAEGDTETALNRFHEAAATRPDNPQIPISAAVAALRANQPDIALELLGPAAKRFPNSAALHRTLGAAQYRRGDYKSSQVALQQALSLDKSSALSYLLMGCTLAKLGQREAAEANFRQARSLDSRYNSVVR